MIKILLAISLLAFVSHASDGSEFDRILRKSCGQVEAPEHTELAYPISVCKVTIEALEVVGDVGINDFYEIVYSDHTREIWQPVSVNTARIMCITTPCPYGIRNYTLQLVTINSKQTMAAGAYLVNAQTPESFFFIKNKTTYDVPNMKAITK